MTKSVTSSADDLESLNNNDLRALCIEHGLPNVPITDTSRKLLINRLRTAIGGSGGNKTPGAKSKSRRETFHVVTKVTESERDSSPKKSRETRGVSTRRTIAAPSEPEPEDEPTVEVTVRQVTNRRRSRTTPVPVTKAAPAAEKRKSSILIEDDEDDDSDVQVVQNNRDSRSPSLAKSKMVTTSYKHIFGEESAAEDSAYKPQPRETIIPIRRETTYESVKPTVRTQERETISSAYLNRPSPQLSRPSISTSNTSYTTSTTRRYTTSGLKPQTEYISTSSTYKPQTEYISSSSTYKPQTEYISSSSTYKPQTEYTTTSTTYRPISSSTYRHEVENSDENEEEEEEGGHVPTPFLSDFARRLSRLKAEPLTPIVPPVEKEGPLYRESKRFYKSTMIAPRRGINPKGSLGESFLNLWIALDRQYGLRKYLAVIAITLVILFIYIMLVQN